MKKIIFFSIIIITFVVILFGVITFFIYSKKPQQPFLSSINQNSHVDRTAWTTYTNDAYKFSIQLPPNLKMQTTEGSTNFAKRFLALDIGTTDDLDILRNAEEGPGAGGPPLYLRISVEEPKNPESLVPCGEDTQFTKKRTVGIDNIPVTKCEGLVLGSFPGLFMQFTRDGELFYVIDSQQYTEENRVLIDQIISTFRFL